MIQQPRRFRRQGWIVLAALLVVVVLAVTAGAAISSLHMQGQPRYQSAVGTPVYIPTPTPNSKAQRSGSGVASLPPSPVIGPASKSPAPGLPATIGVIFADSGGIYLLRSDAVSPEKLTLPDYSALVSPLLTSEGQLLFTGNNGLYLLDLLHGDTTTPFQIASIDSQKQVIASMTMSADGQEVFWSVEPHNGSGVISMYEAALRVDGAATPTLLYSQPANNCPCYMIFGLAGADANGAATLLVTDNLGTPADQGTGLWAFNQTQQQIGQQVLPEDQGQAPLMLSPDHTLLAYAPTTGEVPEPTDGSIPNQVGSQPFGNSLSVVGLNASGPGKTVRIVPAQTNVHNFSAYHWITTPSFSPDNQSIAYIQFSSDSTGPYDRHSTLYVAPTNGSGQPLVVANFSARLVEVGGWLDNHTLLLYADNGIYALDTRTAAIALLTTVRGYSQIIGLVQITSDLPGPSSCAGQCPH